MRIPKGRIAFTVTEAATASGLSTRAVNGEIRNGRLKAHDRGDRKLIKTRDLVSWLVRLPGCYDPKTKIWSLKPQNSGKDPAAASTGGTQW